MKDSIFTKIINGQIPSYKIYEDDKIYCFLDIYPIQPGHTLVVPKQQIDHFDNLDDKTYKQLFEVVKQVSKRLKEVLGVERACLQVLGFDVPHAHVHIIPCNKGQDFYNLPDHSAEPNHSELTVMAKRLSFEGENNG